MGQNRLYRLTKEEFMQDMAMYPWLLPQLADRVGLTTKEFLEKVELGKIEIDSLGKVRVK